MEHLRAAESACDDANVTYFKHETLCLDARMARILATSEDDICPLVDRKYDLASAVYETNRRVHDILKPLVGTLPDLDFTEENTAYFPPANAQWHKFETNSTSQEAYLKLLAPNVKERALTYLRARQTLFNVVRHANDLRRACFLQTLKGQMDLVTRLERAYGVMLSRCQAAVHEMKQAVQVADLVEAIVMARAIDAAKATNEAAKPAKPAKPAKAKFTKAATAPT